MVPDKNAPVNVKEVEQKYTKKVKKEKVEKCDKCGSLEFAHTKGHNKCKKCGFVWR